MEAAAGKKVSDGRFLLFDADSLIWVLSDDDMERVNSWIDCFNRLFTVTNAHR